MPRVLAGELLVSVEKHRHPARGREFCTASELVVVATVTGKQIAIGHRHFRDGRSLTKDGLDPKWVLHENVIYSE
jgi:hypothetical protein